jgi:hypothetical protein
VFSYFNNRQPSAFCLFALVTEVRMQAALTKFDEKLQAQPTTTKTTKSTTKSGSCCNCAALAQIQQSLNNLIATSCQSSTTPTKPSTSTTTSPTGGAKCVGHYWPIGNQMVTDIVTGKQATSLGSPQFVTDRNGSANGAILVNSTSSAWQLPVDTYFQGDTTVTLWVKANAAYCSDSAFGNCYIFLLYLFKSLS